MQKYISESMKRSFPFFSLISTANKLFVDILVYLVQILNSNVKASTTRSRSEQRSVPSGGLVTKASGSHGCLETKRKNLFQPYNGYMEIH